MSTSKKKEKMQYTEFANKRTATKIWNHFLRAVDGSSAKCKICHNILKTAGGNTTGLYTHLRTKHTQSSIDTEVDHYSSSSSNVVDITPGPSKEKELTTTSTGAKKRKVMTDYFKSPSMDIMEVMVSRMAALDGCSFRLFTSSQDLRNLFKKSGNELPKSPHTIAKIVLTQAERVKEDMINKIQNLKESGHRFSLTLDEWTSLRNKRYMNINVHCKGFGGFEFKNLGLVKITGSMSGLMALNILRDHLAKFTVSLEEDVISQTTDGASVMVKMGRFCKGYHHLCLAHGVQLGVIDTLYKKSTEIEIATAYTELTSDTNNTASELESDEDNDETGFEIEIPIYRVDPIIYKEVIKKVRRLVKMVRKSPLKADALREYVIKEYGKDIQLQLDCRTRWSSMSDMIGVFLKVKNSVFKALIDWKSDISFSEDEIKTLMDIHLSLNVIKLAVLSICQRDATLYTADTALRFMLKKLEEQNSFLSLKLVENLRSRIKQRRLLLAGVLHYLHDSEGFFAQTDDETFPKPNAEEVSEIIVNLLTQLKYKNTQIALSENNVSTSDEETIDKEEGEEASLQEQLNRELTKCKERRNISTNFDLAGFVKVEKAMYDNGGERGVYLTEAYKYISCILPTSVESERVFSSAGYFCNRIRSSLSDKMLDALIFLRSHYQEERESSKK